MGLRRFLVVDDEPTFAEMLGDLLRDHGAEVEVAISCGQAFEKVQRGHFDALITDLRMPDMNGVELVRAVHQLVPGLPGILITGDHARLELSESARAQLHAVLPKPVSFRRLMAALDAIRPPVH